VQPIPRIGQSARLQFLSGLVTIDNAMIALINLSHLLSNPAEDAEPEFGVARATVAKV
jgi:chemotaxis signal transduction protein